MMDLDSQQDLGPLNRHFSHPLFQIPLTVRTAVWRLTPDKNLGTTYVEADASSGLRIDFFWITDTVFGHVTGSSDDYRWPEVGVNTVPSTVSGQIRPVASIRKVALENPVFTQLGTSEKLSIETAAKVTFEDGHTEIIGSVDVSVDSLRQRRDRFIDSLLRSAVLPRPNTSGASTPKSDV